MPRIALKPEERRRTISFSISGMDEKRLDDIIEEKAQEYPYAEVSRQTILETLIKEFIQAEGHKKYIL